MNNSQISPHLTSKMSSGEIFSLTNIFENPQVQEEIQEAKKGFYHQILGFVLFFLPTSIFLLSFLIPILPKEYHSIFKNFIICLGIFFVFGGMFWFFTFIKTTIGDIKSSKPKIPILNHFSWIFKNNFAFNWGKTEMNVDFRQLEEIKFLKNFSIIAWQFRFFSFSGENFVANSAQIVTQSGMGKNRRYPENFQLLHIKIPQKISQKPIIIRKKEGDTGLWFGIVFTILLFLAIAILPHLGITVGTEMGGNFFLQIITLGTAWLIIKSIWDHKKYREKMKITAPEENFDKNFEILSEEKIISAKLLDKNFCDFLLKFQEKMWTKCEFLFVENEIFIKIHKEKKIFDLQEQNPASIDTYASAYIFLRNLQNLTEEMMKYLQKFS